MALDPKALEANARIKRIAFANSADPDALTGPFATCPFSTEAGAVKHLKLRLEEARSIGAVIPIRGHDVTPAKAARWFMYLRFTQLMKICVRICAAYERFAGTEFCLGLEEVPKFKVRLDFGSRLAAVLADLGDAEDPGEIAINRAMIQCYRIYKSIETHPKLFDARMKYRGYKDEKEYAETMTEAGWSEEEFDAYGRTYNVGVSREAHLELW